MVVIFIRAQEQTHQKSLLLSQPWDQRKRRRSGKRKRGFQGNEKGNDVHATRKRIQGRERRWRI